MNVCETIKQLNSEKTDAFMHELYGNGAAENKARYEAVLKGFKEAFGDSEEVLLFSSPGRTEISGNHTDHNHGKVLTASIAMDTIAAARKNGTSLVHVISEGYKAITIDLENLDSECKCKGTLSLLIGMFECAIKKGYKVEGFDAYITTEVIGAAGVSSSASFEMLICAIMNYFSNEGKIDYVEYAKIGQYAEHEYWLKQSGLLDQMACAVGGLITIDFVEPMTPVVQKIDFDFKAQNHSLIIVQTGKGHADLSAEYSSIPEEMKKVAKYFGKDVLAQISEEKVIQHLPEIRKFAGDRAVLRALHFFEENKRVEAEVAALKEGRFNDFLENITASGNSSWKWLQNCFTTSNNAEQGITVALALTELFIAQKQRGACRVHGGGFAGVIMAMLPNDLVEEYTKYMEKCLGEGCAYNMSIRPYGAICVSDYL